MNFDELHALIPYAKGGKEKVLRMSPYPDITLALPGRHAEQTTPKGGDFVVMVTDRVFKYPDHQFTHADIFNDVEEKSESALANFFMYRYYEVIIGEDPDKMMTGMDADLPGIEFRKFLHAAQCLAVAEHRRYHKYEDKFGGRYLPFRAAAGIAARLWTAEEASEKTRKAGRVGIEWLEKERGTPDLTKELMK